MTVSGDNSMVTGAMRSEISEVAAAPSAAIGDTALQARSVAVRPVKPRNSLRSMWAPLGTFTRRTSMIRSGPLLLQLATPIYFASRFVVKKLGANCTQNLHPRAKAKLSKRKRVYTFSRRASGIDRARLSVLTRAVELPQNNQIRASGSRD